MKVENETKRIMVFGTFDGLHPGHLNFFTQARKLAKKSYLIASVARDVNVKKIKGKTAELKEKKRVTLLQKIKLIDRVVLAGTKNYLPHIIKERPDIIALGYDQVAYVKNLKKDLKNLGFSIKIVRLKPYKKHIFKNHLLKQKSAI